MHSSSMTTRELQYHNNIRDRRAAAMCHGAMKSSLSCVGVLWALLSFVTMGLSCVGFYMPYWMEGTMRNNTPTSLGVFRRCNYLALSAEGNVEIVMQCGRYTTFYDIPSLWWQVATVTVGVGCGLTMLVAFTAMFSCCIADIISNTTAKIGGILQFLAGLCIATGCVFYPIGWESQEVQQVCGAGTQAFNPGSCTLSWAYYCTIAGGGGALLCSLMSCHAAKYHGGYQRTASYS